MHNVVRNLFIFQCTLLLESGDFLFFPFFFSFFYKTHFEQQVRKLFDRGYIEGDTVK